MTEEITKEEEDNYEGNNILLLARCFEKFFLSIYFFLLKVSYSPILPL